MYVRSDLRMEWSGASAIDVMKGSLGWELLDVDGWMGTWKGAAVGGWMGVAEYVGVG